MSSIRRWRWVLIITNIFVESSLDTSVVAAMGVASKSVGAGVVGAAMDMAAVSGQW